MTAWAVRCITSLTWLGVRVRVRVRIRVRVGVRVRARVVDGARLRPWLRLRLRLGLGLGLGVRARARVRSHRPHTLLESCFVNVGYPRALGAGHHDIARARLVEEQRALAWSGVRDRVRG